jgi:uncharacterized protein (TIGR02391 family)
MRSGLRQLDRCEVTLRAFNVAAITDHGDQNAEGLRLRYNAAIAGIFVGEETIEYARYSIGTFDQGPQSIRLDGAFFRGGHYVNVEEVRAGYRQGIGEALSHIDTIRQIFRDRLQDVEEEDPTTRITRAFGDLDIHPSIADASAGLVEDGHYANAVEDACKALEALVQKRSGRSDLSGTALMQTAFSPSAPVLRVADLSTQTGRDEQQGMMFMFTGAMLGLRNPRAHSLRSDDPERAIEYIAFISMLAKIAEAASR